MIPPIRAIAAGLAGLAVLAFAGTLAAGPFGYCNFGCGSSCGSSCGQGQGCAQGGCGQGGCGQGCGQNSQYPTSTGNCHQPRVDCPPPYCHVYEGPPVIKFKRGCPRPVCDPGKLPHFGYFQTCWSPWPYPPDWRHCPYPTASDMLPPPSLPPFTPRLNAQRPPEPEYIPPAKERDTSLPKPPDVSDGKEKDKDTPKPKTSREKAREREREREMERERDKEREREKAKEKESNKNNKSGPGPDTTPKEKKKDPEPEKLPQPRNNNKTNDVDIARPLVEGKATVEPEKLPPPVTAVQASAQQPAAAVQPATPQANQQPASVVQPATSLQPVVPVPTINLHTGTAQPATKETQLPGGPQYPSQPGTQENPQRPVSPEKPQIPNPMETSRPLVRLVGATPAQ